MGVPSESKILRALLEYLYKSVDPGGNIECRSKYYLFEIICVQNAPKGVSCQQVWNILKGAYVSSNTMILDYLKEKHVCNDEGNCIIIESYTFHDVNETFLIDQL